MSSKSLQTYHIGKKSIHVIDIKTLHGKIFSQITERGIRKTLEGGKSIVIFINKKGAHTGMVCKECGHIPYCSQCDVPIGLFQNSHQHLFGLCPICQEVYQIINACPSCGQKKLEPYGIGIQHAEKYCKDNFSTQVISIQSSTANSHRKIETLFQEIENKPSIILTTSLLQFPIINNCEMVIFQNGIQTNIPDYNTECRNFQFLHNCIHSYNATHFIIQTYQPKHHIIQSIGEDNPDLFYKQDAHFRQKHNYPPHGELCIISYKHPLEKSLFTKVNNLFHDMLALRQKGGYNQIDIYAIPAIVYKVYGKYRYQIIVKGPSIREFVDQVFINLKPFSKGFKFDRGAQSFF